MFRPTEKEFQPSWWERLGAEIVKTGPIPKHIAIILDGNRRYARLNKLGNVSEGHVAGADKVGETIDMLLLLGVKELTIYAFSTENFKRSMQEVNAIFKLAEEETKSTIKYKEAADRKGVCVEYIGNQSLNPSPILQKSMEESMILTRHNNTLKVNVAFIYTARHEICQGINKFLNGVPKGEILIDDLTETVLPDFFTLHPSRTAVDILIRTSGECRFSDFMIWQCAQARLEFVKVTWPEFTFCELLKIIFRYQIHYKQISAIVGATGPCEVDENVRKYISKMRDQKWNQMKLSEAYVN